MLYNHNGFNVMMPFIRFKQRSCCIHLLSWCTHKTQVWLNDKLDPCLLEFGSKAVELIHRQRYTKVGHRDLFQAAIPQVSLPTVWLLALDDMPVFHYGSAPAHRLIVVMGLMQITSHLLTVRWEWLSQYTDRAM